MYRKDDTSYFIVDAHVALWDARPENQRNIHGKQFIDCFYDYHRNLSPESEVWTYEDYLYQGGERLMKDLFDDGYVDHAIFQPAQLGEFYYKGFGQTDEAFELAKPTPGQADLQPQLRPAQRRGRASISSARTPRSTASRASSSTPPSGTASPAAGGSTTRGPTATSRPAANSGIRNIHVHKGPTIRPLDRDAFDVADVDHVGVGLHRSELHRRALRAAATGGLLLDRHPGAQRLRRPRGGDAVHPHPPEVLRADHG